MQVALRAWEHLIRCYLPASEAPTLNLEELTHDKLSPAERQADTDFIRPVINLICTLFARAVDAGFCTHGRGTSPGRLDRCELFTEVCLLLPILLRADQT